MVKMTPIQQTINKSTGVGRKSNSWEIRLASRQNQKFQTQIDKYIINTTEKMLAVMRQSLQETVQMTQVPVKKGGKMRVDTGFLRSSGKAELNRLPVGPSMNPTPLRPKDQRGIEIYSFDGGNLELTLAEMKFGDTFYWGWTANYAKYREAYDGFMEAALQNWQNTVDSVVARIKQKFSK